LIALSILSLSGHHLLCTCFAEYAISSREATVRVIVGGGDPRRWKFGRGPLLPY
jgi:hypothetical protein